MMLNRRTPRNTSASAYQPSSSGPRWARRGRGDGGLGIGAWPGLTRPRMPHIIEPFQESNFNPTRLHTWPLPCSLTWIFQHPRKPLPVFPVLKIRLPVQRHPGVAGDLAVGHAFLETRAEVDDERQARAPEIVIARQRAPQAQTKRRAAVEQRGHIGQAPNDRGRQV